MKYHIEIHDNNEDFSNVKGTYRIWFKVNGKQQVRTCSEAFTNSLLNMRQKEDFLWANIASMFWNQTLIV